MDTKSADKIKELRQLLFLDADSERVERIGGSLNEVINDLNIPERFEKRVTPIIEINLDRFLKTIPEKMGPAITLALKKQVKESQHEVVDALYPLVGKLIVKFVKVEIENISRKVDEELDKIFTVEGWNRRIKSWFSGSKESDLIIREAIRSELHELFIIKKGSGLLAGHYSKTNRINADMIAGMLTAIKSFAEDAFGKAKEELESIDYESYKIRIYNIKSFYIAAVVSGVLTSEFNSKLQNAVFEFVDLYVKDRENIDAENVLSDDLKKLFGDFSI